MKGLVCAILALAAHSFGFGQESPIQFDRPVVADQYLIRPGDVLTVTFLKANLEPLKLEVDPEGRVIHRNLGLFDLSQKTLTQAKEALLAAAKSLYKVENVIISINNPLMVRFSITGAVKNPGSYQGYTSQRVSDVIKMAGGVLPDGSSRNIRLSGGPSDIRVDLDLMEYTGDLESDPCLYAGYTIHVPQKSDSRVQVMGEVNFPREIELQNGDNLGLLITMVGGYRKWADSNNIHIIRNDNLYDALNEPIQAGDILKVSALSDIPEYQSVMIFGAVTKPGKFKKSDVSSLDNLIKMAGGFDSAAAKPGIAVFRFNPLDASGRISTHRSVIQNVYAENNPGREFALSGGDSIFVPYFVGYVEVEGMVANPGTFPFSVEKTAEYYINLAGNYLADADRMELGVYDPISKITARRSPKIQIQDGFKITVNIRKGLE